MEYTLKDFVFPLVVGQVFPEEDRCIEFLGEVLVQASMFEDQDHI